MKTDEGHRIQISLIIVTLVILATSGAMAGRGDCLTVVVPSPVVLPDGSVHEPGALRICFARQLNPVSEMQKISVSGASKGLFIGKNFESEAETVRPVVLFHRNANDEWILVGYALPARNRTDRPTSVRLTDPARLHELVVAGMAERPAPSPNGIRLSGYGVTGQELETIVMAAR